MASNAGDTTVVPSSAPTNKAVAATGASAFGAAVSTIALYLISLTGAVLPEDVKGAITIIVTGLVTLAAAYYTPPGSSEAVVVSDEGKVTTGRTVVRR